MAPIIKYQFIKWFVLFGLLASASVTAFAQKQADIRVILSLSQSMQDNDPERLRHQAGIALIDQLPDGARAGVWTYAKYVNMLVPLRDVDSTWKKSAKSALENLKLVGRLSHFHDALKAATRDWQASDARYQRHLIVISDGKIQTAGKNDSALRDNFIKTIAPRIARAGVRTTVLSIGKNIDSKVLQSLATANQSRFKHMTNLVDFKQAFSEIFKTKKQAEKNNPATPPVVKVAVLEDAYNPHAEAKPTQEMEIQKSPSNEETLIKVDTEKQVDTVAMARVTENKKPVVPQVLPAQEKPTVTPLAEIDDFALLEKEIGLNKAATQIPQKNNKAESKQKKTMASAKNQHLNGKTDWQLANGWQQWQFLLLVFMFLVCLTVGLTVMWIARRKQEQIQKAIDQLFASLNRRTSKRRKALGNLMQAVYQVQDDELNGMVNTVLEQEKLFYKHFKAIILQRTSSSIASFYRSVDELGNSYFQFGKQTEDNQGKDAQVLSAENTRLTEQMELTRQTLNQVFMHFIRAKALDCGDPQTMSVKEIAGFLQDFNITDEPSEPLDDNEEAQDSLPENGQVLDDTSDCGLSQDTEQEASEEDEVITDYSMQVAQRADEFCDGLDEAFSDQALPEESFSDVIEPEPEEKVDTLVDSLDGDISAIQSAIAEAAAGDAEDVAELAAELDELLNQVETDVGEEYDSSLQDKQA